MSGALIKRPGQLAGTEADGPLRAISADDPDQMARQQTNDVFAQLWIAGPNPAPPPGSKSRPDLTPGKRRTTHRIASHRQKFA